MKAGHVDGGTLLWWFDQSPEARELFKRQDKAVALATALDGLTTFMRATKGGVPVVWGNGASFDITILENAYLSGAVGLRPAWTHTNIRDMRTIVDLAQGIAGFDPHLPFDGVAHNAQADATHQAKVIAAAFKALRGKLAPPPKEREAPPPNYIRYWQLPNSDAMVVTAAGVDPLDMHLMKEVTKDAYIAWEADQL